jgi:hypothetical protein
MRALYKDVGDTKQVGGSTSHQAKKTDLGCTMVYSYHCIPTSLKTKTLTKSCHFQEEHDLSHPAYVVPCLFSGEQQSNAYKHVVGGTCGIAHKNKEQTI